VKVTTRFKKMDIFELAAGLLSLAWTVRFLVSAVAVGSVVSWHWPQNLSAYKTSKTRAGLAWSTLSFIRLRAIATAVAARCAVSNSLVPDPCLLDVSRGMSSKAPMGHRILI